MIQGSKLVKIEIIAASQGRSKLVKLKIIAVVSHQEVVSNPDTLAGLTQN